MPSYTTKETIIAAVKLFNERAYNASFSFKVESTSNNCVETTGTFDLWYGINVYVDFKEVVYTNLQTDNKWPDAWNNDQLFLLDDKEVVDILAFNTIEYPVSGEPLFGFLFNINGRNDFRSGVINLQISLYRMEKSCLW